VTGENSPRARDVNEDVKVPSAAALSIAAVGEKCKGGKCDVASVEEDVGVGGGARDEPLEPMG